MTREELILQRLNHAEGKLKRIIEANKEEAEIDKQVAYINGLQMMLETLGYRAIEDESKAENVGDWWIYHYIKIEDTTGRK